MSRKRRTKDEWNAALGIKSNKQLGLESLSRNTEQRKENWKKKFRGIGSPVRHLSIKEYWAKKATEANTRRDFQPEAPQASKKRRGARFTFIYALCDPHTGVARYVGKSNYPDRRYEQHIQDFSGPKGYWIKFLLANGDRPVLKILEQCDYDTWELRERHWIAELKKTQTLFNRTAGGDQSNRYDLGNSEYKSIPTASQQGDPGDDAS